MAETLTSTLPDPDYNADLYRDVPVKRLVAWFVDLLLITLLTAVFVPLTLFTAFFFLPLLFLIVSFFYRWLTISSRSATPGMRFAAIELRGEHGGHLDGSEAFLHTAGYHVSMAIFPLQLVSIVLMLISDRKQGLTDHLLGTVALNRSAGY